MAGPVSWSAHIVVDDPNAMLPEALRGLQALSPVPSVTVIDNAPAGQKRPDIAWPGLRWLRNPRAQTVGRSFNQAMELALAHAQGDLENNFALLLSPDVIVGTDLIPKLDALFDAEPLLGAVGPKLRRAHIAGSLDGEHREIEFTDTLDAIGISSNWLGKIGFRGRGERDDGQQIFKKPAFAPAPACFAVRLSAVRALSVSGPWFREKGDWQGVAVGFFRRLKGAEYRLTVATEAVSWRLTPRV